MKTITAVGKDFELYSFSGIVADSGKNMETKVSGSGGGATFRGYGGTAPVSIRSKTVIHDQIFLINAQGDEKSFQLQGFNIACRKDNKLAVIWAMPKGSKTGPYIVVHNYSTKETYYNDKAIDGLFTPMKVLWFAVIAVISIIIGQLTGWAVLIGTVIAVIYVVVRFNKQFTQFKSSIDLRDFE